MRSILSRFCGIIPQAGNLAERSEFSSGDAVSSEDKTRFANVVMPHLTDAYALARWITGDRADAEDVVQEASLRAFRGDRRFRRHAMRAPGC